MVWGSQERFDLNNIQAVAVLKLKHATCWNSSARRKKKTPRHFTDGQMGITLQYISHVQRDCVFPSLELFCVQQQETGFPHQLTNKKNKAAPGRSRTQSQKVTAGKLNSVVFVSAGVQLWKAWIHRSILHISTIRKQNTVYHSLWMVRYTLSLVNKKVIHIVKKLQKGISDFMQRLLDC